MNANNDIQAELNKEITGVLEKIRDEAKFNLFWKHRIKTAAGNHVTTNHYYTGALYNSIKMHKTGTGGFIDMLHYGIDVDRGRRQGHALPRKVVEKWIKDKPIRLRNMNKKSPQFGEFIKKTPDSIRRAAWLINRSIYKNGILPTYFLSEPVNEFYPKFEKDLDNILNKLFDENMLNIK